MNQKTISNINVIDVTRLDTKLSNIDHLKTMSQRKRKM